MNEAHLHQLFEDYLNGQLRSSEQQAFEERLQQDPEFALQFEEHRHLVGSLRSYGRRAAIKQQLNTIHAAMEAEQARTNPASGLRVFWNRHRATMAVAASVALVTFFFTFMLTNMRRPAGTQHVSQYRELRREVQALKNTQEALIKDISETERRPGFDPGRFSGTGFAISSNGYFVTSYHVIKDADSVMIETGKGELFRAATVHADTAHDIAILKVQDPHFKSFGKLPYGFKTSESELGERVFTLGYPREQIVYGEGSLSSSTGFQGDPDMYQVSIPVNPGNSGGPLLDTNGNLIGIISGVQTETQGAAFAIKSSYLISLMASLAEKDSLAAPLKPAKASTLSKSPRTQQIKRVQDYVFNVKVYN